MQGCNTRSPSYRLTARPLPCVLSMAIRTRTHAPVRDPMTGSCTGPTVQAPLLRSNIRTHAGPHVCVLARQASFRGLHACLHALPPHVACRYHSVDLLQRGFVGGSIVTVDPEEARLLGKPWTRRWGAGTGWQRLA